jgi:hypothetical protein
MKNKFLYIFLPIFFVSFSIYSLYPNSYEIIFNKEIASSDIDKYDIFVSSYRISNTRKLNNSYLNLKSNNIGYWLIISRDDVVSHKMIPVAGPSN